MSSFINKSGKKFVPKAPARRRGGTGPKPISESGTAEPSPAPQSDAGSDIGDRSQTSAPNVSEKTAPVVAPAIAGPKSLPPAKSPIHEVDSSGIAVVQQSSVARSTRPTVPLTNPALSNTSDTQNDAIHSANTTRPSVPPPNPALSNTSSTQKDAVLSANASPAATRARSVSPAGKASSTEAPSPKRRRVEEPKPRPEDPKPRSAPSKEVPAPEALHVEICPAAQAPVTRPTTEQLRSTTPLQPPPVSLLGGRGSATILNGSAASSSTEKARQWPLGNQVPQPATRSSKPGRPAKSAARESLVEYEVPGQTVVSASSQPPAPVSPAVSRPTPPVRTPPVRIPRPRTPSEMEDEGWQVTTPADIAASSHKGKERRSRVRFEDDEDDPTESATPGESSAAQADVTSAAVRRLANAVKRKRKQAARDAVVGRLTGVAAANAIDAAVASSIEAPGPRPVSVRPERMFAENDDPPRRRVVKRGKREPTPEENQHVMITPGMTRMNDLARDMRVGLKSEREKKMREINWKEIKRKRKEDEIRQATHRGRDNADGDAYAAGGGGIEEDEDGLDEDERLERNYQRNKKAQGQQSIRMRLVNGEHQIDEASQFIDRHAMQEEELLEEVEEDDLTKKFNVATYATWRRKDPAERVLTHEKWSEDATDRFYDFLSQFGTDFMVISKMFRGRTRRHIKAKFVKEERADPERIKQALLRHLTRRNEGDGWDIEAFRVGAGLSHTDLKDPEAIKKELEVSKAEMEIEIEEARKETAEHKRQKKLAGFSSDEEYDEDGEPLPPDEVARRKKEKQDKIKRDKREARKAKVAKKHGPPTGGEEEEVVETIEGEDN